MSPSPASFHAERALSYEYAISTRTWRDEDRIRQALEHFNWRHTHPDAASQLKPLLESCVTSQEIEKQIYQAGNAHLRAIGHPHPVAPGEKFVFLVKLNWLKGSVADPSLYDLGGVAPSEMLVDYLASRARRNKWLWLTDWNPALPPRNQLLEWMWELGLQHFGQVDRTDPIYVFQLEATEHATLLKPTWVHAFCAWYFDPAPEFVHHGMSRSLRTGEHKRKEWCVDCQTATSCFKLADCYTMDFAAGEIHRLQDLPEEYWHQTRERVLKLHT